MKRVDKLLKSHVDGQCRTRPCLPGEPWTKRIYWPGLYMQKDGANHIFTTNNATIGARVYLSGADHLLGVPAAAVPGNGLRETRHAMSNMSMDELKALAKDKHSESTGKSSNARLRWWTGTREAHGGVPFPLTVEKLRRGAAILEQDR